MKKYLQIRMLKCLPKRLIAMATMGLTSVCAQNVSSETVVLDPFTVQESGEGSIGATESVSATRFVADIKDLPFAVNVLTEMVINDLSVTDVKDLVQFAGSVVNGGNGFGTTTNNSVRLRGFPISKNLINGFSYAPNFNVAPNSIQRVEVLKGPASLLYGAIPPGGVINYITKRPTAEQRGSVRYIMGSWNLSRLDFDISGPLTENLRYLVNVSQEDREFYSYGAERQTAYINTQIDFDFADKRGNLLVDYSQVETDQLAVNSAPPRLPAISMDPYGRLADEVDRNYPVPNFNIRDSGAPLNDQSENLLLQFRYILSDNYTLRAAYRIQDEVGSGINQATVGFPVFRGGPTATGIQQPGDANYGVTGNSQWDSQGTFGTSDNLQLNLLSTYDFGWGKFQVMPGFDYNQQDDWFWRFRAGVLSPTTGKRSGNFFSKPKNIFDRNTWTFDAPAASQYIVDDPRTAAYEGPGLLRNNEGNEGSSTDYYVYGSGTFLNDRLIVTLGYRDSSFENTLLTTDEKVAPKPSQIIRGENLTGGDDIYQYGAVYKLVPDKLHLYGNFAQSFEPQLRSIKLIDSDGNPLDLDLNGDGIKESPDVNDNQRVPAKHLFGEGWEVGLKGSLGEDGKYGYGLTYFTTTNNNIIRNITVGKEPEAYETWFPNLDAATKALIAALPTGERIEEFQVQSGEEQASGVEFELTATPIKGWDLRATYTNLDAFLVKDPSSPQAEGRTLPNSPEHNFNLFTRYAFQDRLEGVFVGGSADYFSVRYSGAPQNGTAGLKAHPRTMVNVFAGYRVKLGANSYRLQLNVQNLTDVFDTEGDNLGAVVLPRSYRLTLGVDF